MFTLEESAAPREARTTWPLLSQQGQELGGEAGPGRDTTHAARQLCHIHLLGKETGQGYRSHPPDEETEAQRGQRAFLRPQSQAAAELGIRARPAPPSVPAPPHSSPWPGSGLTSPAGAPWCLLCAPPSEPAAWFSPINYSRSQGLASSGYTDRSPGHLPCPPLSSPSQDLEGPRFTSKVTWWALNVPP